MSDLDSSEHAISKLKGKFDRSKKIAVHLHLYYLDLIPEFVWYLNNIPYPYDLYISCQLDASENYIREMLAEIKMVQNITIKKCPNRGRDIAPLYVWFRTDMINYDYILHIHTKKSLHAGTEKIEWRQMSLDCLLGSSKIVKKILGLLDGNQKIGLVYPEFTDDLCNYDCSWLRNDSIGKEFLDRLNIEWNHYIFMFPAGSFFWAKMEAIKPIFDIGLEIDDFPIEKGQVDATLAHALERAVSVVAESRDYSGALVDLDRGVVKYRRSLKLFQDYLKDNLQKVNERLKCFDVISFDVFGTLVTSKAYDQSLFFQCIEDKYPNFILPEYQFVIFRKKAEKKAVKLHGASTKLIHIYECFAEMLHMDMETAKQIMKCEIETLIHLCVPRKDILHIYRSMIYENKRISIIADTYYPYEVIRKILKNCGYPVNSEMWISCEIGKRKDDEKLWDAYFDAHVGEKIAHIGDDPSTDWYRVFNRAEVFWIMNGMDEFYMSTLYEKYADLLKGDMKMKMQLGELINEHYFNSPFSLEKYLN